MVLKHLGAVFCLPLLSFFFLLSCTPSHQSYQTSLMVYRFHPPAFVEFSEALEPINEIPFSIPLHCALFDIFPAPIGPYLLIELSCPNGQTVLFLDTTSGSMAHPVAGTDSHFLAWASDGKSTYLKVDSLGEARLIRAGTRGSQDEMEVSGWTYDLAAKPDSYDFIFTFSRGLGYGSELYFAQGNGLRNRLIYEDKFNYISFARYSPEGDKIAFIKIPDSQTPFTVGELWVMEAGGLNPRKLAEADAGHGYAANWSPGGEWIAFVKRENPLDENADQTSDSLISNIYLVNIQNGELAQVTTFVNGRAETPHWSPDGNLLAFNTVLDGRMDVQIADIASGEIWSLMAEPTCCPAWMRK